MGMMMSDINILDVIKSIRESFGGSIVTYTCGNCYQFYEILKTIFHEAEAFYDGNHVWTKINNKFYDIKGEKEIDEKYLKPIIESERIESLSKNKWPDERRKLYAESYKEYLITNIKTNQNKKQTKQIKQKTNQNKMEQREIRLGDLRVVRSDLGLDFYTKEYDKKLSEDQTEYGDGPGHLWLNERSVQVLRDWLNEEPKYKQIDYRDRGYQDKRKTLRQLSIKDEISNFLNIVTDDVLENIRYSIGYKAQIRKILDVDGNILYNCVKSFLVDGFLSFELIFDEKSKLIDIKQLDPVSLEYHEEEGKKYWIQHSNIESMKRVLSDTQVIYLTYSDGKEYFVTSYVEQLKESYEKFKLAESQLVFENVTNSAKKDMSMKTVKWLEKNMNKVSMISESMIKDGEYPSSTNIKYNRFINRISDIFKDNLLNKLKELLN